MKLENFKHMCELNATDISKVWTDTSDANALNEVTYSANVELLDVLKHGKEFSKPPQPSQQVAQTIQ